jgi:hypothetical protein
MSLPEGWLTPDGIRPHWLSTWLKVLVLGCAMGALLAYVAWRGDWSGVQRSRAELARATARTAAIQAVPVPTRIAATRAPVPLADLLMQLTRMVEESGLRLRTLERVPAEKISGATAGSHGESAAALHFRLIAMGDFFAMRRWLSGLPRLPALVAPSVLEVRREAGGNVLEADLQLFADLPGTADDERVSKTAAESVEAVDAIPVHPSMPIDPFGPFAAVSVAEAETEAVAGNWQLAGLLRDARHGLALFEQSGETRVLARGHALDAASLKSVEARGVLLTLPGGSMRRIQLRGRVMR